MTWGAVAIGSAGVVGSLAGGLLSSQGASDAANAQNQAGADARNFSDQRTAEGAFRQLVMLYGADQAKAIFKATFPKETVAKILGTPAVAGTPGSPANGGAANSDIAAFNSLHQGADWSQAGPHAKENAFGNYYRSVHGTMPTNDVWAAFTGNSNLNPSGMTAGTPGTDAVPGSFDMAALDAAGPGVEQRMNDYRTEAKNAGEQYLSGYDKSTQGLLRDSQAIERGSMGYGEQERQRINRDSATALTGANRVTEGRMLASGLGTSSVLGNQLSGNATSNFNATQDALGTLGDKQLAFNTGLKQNTLGLKTQRQGTRDAVAKNLQEQDLTLGAKPIDMRLQTATGAAMNPWLGQNTTQYFPGASGGGGAIIGNMLSGMGGQAVGFGAQTLTNAAQMRQLQELLKRSGSASGGGGGGVNNYGADGLAW